MNERLRAQLIVRDGVLYVSEWEWNTSERQILGFSCVPYVIALNGPNPFLFASLTFENEWMIFFALSGTDGPGIEIWSCDLHDLRMLDTPHIFVQTLDRLLGCIRTVAERPARKEVPSG